MCARIHGWFHPSLPCQRVVPLRKDSSCPTCPGPTRSPRQAATWSRGQGRRFVLSWGLGFLKRLPSLIMQLHEELLQGSLGLAKGSLTVGSILEVSLVSCELAYCRGQYDLQTGGLQGVHIDSCKRAQMLSKKGGLRFGNGCLLVHATYLPALQRELHAVQTGSDALQSRSRGGC